MPVPPHHRHNQVDDGAAAGPSMHGLHGEKGEKTVPTPPREVPDAQRSDWAREQIEIAVQTVASSSKKQQAHVCKYLLLLYNPRQRFSQNDPVNRCAGRTVAEIIDVHMEIKRHYDSLVPTVASSRDSMPV